MLSGGFPYTVLKKIWLQHICTVGSTVKFVSVKSIAFTAWHSVGYYTNWFMFCEQKFLSIMLSVGQIVV